MRLKAENTIAIAIDYQEKLVPAMASKEQMMKKSQILLAGLKALEVPVILTTQYAKGLGNTVPEIDDVLENAVAYDKHTFSVFQCQEVVEAIPEGTKNIIICGMEAHICVLQSLIDLQKAGYQVTFVADCVASRDEVDKAFALVRAEQEGAYISTAEAILYELLEDAKHPAFKTISNLVK